MANFVKTYSAFSQGEISPEFFARDNINGLSRLENMDVLGGGGLRRRPGLVNVATLYGAARLIPFCVSETKKYLLSMTANHLVVYCNGEMQDDILTPWGASDISRVQYAQRFGSIIFVHPDYAPRILRESSGSFNLSTFEFARDDATMNVLMPFMRFDDTSDITISVTAHQNGNNYATFTANRACWTSDYVGNVFYLLGRQWIVSAFVSATQLVAYTNGAYSLPASPITDWREAAFSKYRGWPLSITFHQDRLVFGGSRSHQCGVWLSQVGRHNNFDVGTGLDDEAIFITLLSQQNQRICTVVSSDNLQILTTDGEWAISSKPLTPSVVDIKQHTSVGSMHNKFLPPQQIEGATVFISHSGRDIRQLTLDDLGEKYNARDLCAVSKHLMINPIDIAYNDVERKLYVVMSDGTMAVLNQNAALEISAWARYKTHGDFISVCVIDSETFVCVMRGDEYLLEKFSDSALNDAGIYNFYFCATSLPLHSGGHNARKIRIRKIATRVLNTGALFINNVRAVIPNESYDVTGGFSGDVCVGFLGTSGDSAPIWTIHGDEPQNATVLSVTVYGRYII